RARDQFLACAGRTGDQGGELAHLRVKRPAIAAHVVREDRLPDAGAQTCCRHRVPDDVVVDVVERSLNLPVTGEDMRGLQCAGKGLTGNYAKLFPVRQERAVERPFTASPGEMRMIALIKKIVDALFVDTKLVRMTIGSRCKTCVVIIDALTQLAINRSDVR